MHAENTRRGDAGWTLLEVMAVVMILGIVVSIAIATFSVSAERSRRVTCQSNQHILVTAVGAYQQDHEGALPPDLAALADYVKGRPDYDTCPGGGAAYAYEATNGRVTCPLHPPQ